MVSFTESAIAKILKQEERLCLVIKDPKTRRQVFEGCHVGPAGNHEGRDRKQAKIQEKYYWHGVTKDVKYMVTQGYFL